MEGRDTDNLTEDQQLAVMNFQAMTDTSNMEEALSYLSRNSWDVTEAAQHYFSTQTASSLSASSPSRPSPGRGEEESVRAPMEYSEQTLMGDPREYYYGQTYSYENDPINKLASGVVSSFKSVGSGVKSLWNKVIPEKLRGFPPGGEEFLGRLKRVLGDEELILPKFRKGLFDDACNESLRKKMPLLIYIHSSNDRQIIDFLKNTLSAPYLRELIDDNFIPYGLDSETDEGKKAVRQLEVTLLPYIGLFYIDQQKTPQILCDQAGYEQDNGSIMQLITRGLEIKEKKEEEEQKMAFAQHASSDFAFQQAIRESRQNAVKPISQVRGAARINPSAKIGGFAEQQMQIPSSPPIQPEEDKWEEIPPELLNPPQAEEEPMIPEYTKEEPPAGPDATDLVFRMPKGSRIQRRFLRTDTVEELYAFIKSLANEEFEDPKTDFELGQAMSPPLKDKEKSLEKAGLCPRALIIVKEKQ